MDASPSRRHGLPDIFPVFPLSGALLLPRGRLPLNIFEPRYLAMVEDAMSEGRMFGMVQPDPNRPRAATGPGLFGIGCLGRLSAFSETEDGRYLITLTGVTRFRIVEELPMRRGYRRVHADLAPFANDVAEQGTGRTYDRPALLAALRGYFQRRGFEANWDAIDGMDDEMLVITLSMVCPFEPVEKQALLEAPTLADRAGALLALLQMDTHTGAGERPRAS